MVVWGQAVNAVTRLVVVWGQAVKGGVGACSQRDPMSEAPKWLPDMIAEGRRDSKQKERDSKMMVKIAKMM